MVPGPRPPDPRRLAETRLPLQGFVTGGSGRQRGSVDVRRAPVHLGLHPGQPVRRLGPGGMVADGRRHGGDGRCKCRCLYPGN